MTAATETTTSRTFAAWFQSGADQAALVNVPGRGTAALGGLGKTKGAAGLPIDLSIVLEAGVRALARGCDERSVAAYVRDRLDEFGTES